MYFAVGAKITSTGSRMTQRQTGYLRNSVITVRRSFLLVRFDVVQITRSAITPGQLYRREGLSENAH